MSRVASTGRIALSTLVALLSVATLAGFLDQLNWVFEPAAFFRLQYAAVLGSPALPHSLSGRLRLAAIAVAIDGVNIAAIAPWHGADNPAAPPGAPAVRIVAFNPPGTAGRSAVTRSAHAVSR
jgi:hypothetical protein